MCEVEKIPSFIVCNKKMIKIQPFPSYFSANLNCNNAQNWLNVSECMNELIKSNFFERFRDCMHKLTDSSELRCKNRK